MKKLIAILWILMSCDGDGVPYKPCNCVEQIIIYNGEQSTLYSVTPVGCQDESIDQQPISGIIVEKIIKCKND